MTNLPAENRSRPEFQAEVAKRRREYEYARSKLAEAVRALDAAEIEYGNAQRALNALGYED